MNPLSDYEVFFDLLKVALYTEEAAYDFPGKASDALWKLYKIARGGNTGFVNGVDIPAEVKAYVKWVYQDDFEVSKRPEFLRFYADVL